jgi:hypothetical protein
MRVGQRQIVDQLVGTRDQEGPQQRQSGQRGDAHRRKSRQQTEIQLSQLDQPTDRRNRAVDVGGGCGWRQAQSQLPQARGQQD